MTLRALLAIVCLALSLPVFAQTVPLGDFDPGATVYFPFTTYDSNGASVTISGLATSDIKVYKNGNVTERSSTAGFTLLDTDGTDFDAKTGFHGFSIDTNDNTDAGFYTAPAQYFVLIDSITVDTQTVRFSYYFTLGNYLRATTGGRELEVDSEGNAGADVEEWLATDAASPSVAGVPEVDITHYAGGTATATGGRPEVNVSHISGDSAPADRLEALFDQATCGQYPELGVLRGGGCTAVSYTHATGVLVLDGPAAFADNALQNAIVMICGSTQGYCQAATIESNVGDSATLESPLANTMTGTVTFTIYATPQTSTGTSPPSAAAVADAVWDEDMTGHQTQGSAGQTLGDSGADTDTIFALLNTNLNATVSSRASQTSVDTVDDFVDTEVATIVTATGAAAIRTAVGLASANLDTQLDALPTAAEIRTEMDSNSADLNQLMNARTQIIPAADADGILTADSGDTNTLVDSELTFANAQDIDGAYVVRSDGQRCFVDSFNPATDTIEFSPCTFTGAWSTQTYKIYPANTQ